MVLSHIMVNLIHLDLHPIAPLFFVIIWFGKDVFEVFLIVVSCHHIIGRVPKTDIPCQGECRAVIGATCCGVDQVFFIKVVVPI
jgi:hypothetical protein